MLKLTSGYSNLCGGGGVAARSSVALDRSIGLHSAPLDKVGNLQAELTYVMFTHITGRTLMNFDPQPKLGPIYRPRLKMIGLVGSAQMAGLTTWIRNQHPMLRIQLSKHYSLRGHKAQRFIELH
jgi:hypothetical protein